MYHPHKKLWSNKTDKHNDLQEYFPRYVYQLESDSYGAIRFVVIG